MDMGYLTYGNRVRCYMLLFANLAERRPILARRIEGLPRFVKQ
jgi:hypothetical protein